MADLTWPKQRKLLRAPEIGFNAEVYRHFKEIDDFPNRVAARDACLIGAKDSRSTASFKIQYFREFVQQVHNKPTIVGQPKHQLDQFVQYKCQCFLYFKQDPGSVPKGKQPLAAEIHFRIDETHKTITDAKINTLAKQIKRALVTGNDGYKWNKGKYLAKYDDPENGYFLQIYASSEDEGERVARKILSIQDHPFNEKIFRVTKPKRNSENTTGKITILGEQVSEPRWRPTATVEFAYADLIVWGLDDPISLVDLGKVRPRRKAIYVS